MDTLKLRKKLIEQIETTENLILLEDIHKLLGIETSKVEESLSYQLTDDQHEAVSLAREEIKNGKYLTNEQANQEIDQWLNK